MKDLLRRMVASLLLSIAVICMVLFAYSSWFQYVVALVVASLAGVATWEYEQFAKAKGGRLISPILIGLSFLQVLSFFARARSSEAAILPVAVFFFSLLILFAFHFREKEGAVLDLSVASFGLLYIAVPMGMLLNILYFQTTQDGRWWFVYLLVVTKIADIGAYFGGNLWGRRKLAPHISPAKTVEGAVFGLLCAGAASFAFHFLSRSVGALRFHLGTSGWLFLGLALGITGQFSDLAESLLKRDANKKDSNALPGLGGALDAIDSLLFTTPIIYLYLNAILYRE